MVARLDGRSFARLTKEVHKFEVPYDERFRDYMIETVEHLMNIGLYVIYGYTHSDDPSVPSKEAIAPHPRARTTG